MDAPAIPAASLRQSLASARPPLVIDVRKGPAFLGAPEKAETHTWNPEAYK